MKRFRRLLTCVLILYGIGLVWGYFRLPWAAIKSLADGDIIAAAPAVSFGWLEMSSGQRWYLKRALTQSPVPVVPRVSVEVKWNAIVLARVSCSYHATSKGAESRDSMYLCLFGAWIPVRDYSRLVS
jgi:hypothetical protein